MTTEQAEDRVQRDVGSLEMKAGQQPMKPLARGSVALPSGNHNLGTFDAKTARDFLAGLYGDTPIGLFTICSFNPDRIKLIPATNIDRAVEAAIKLNQQQCTYFGVGLRRIDLDGGRGGGDDVIALTTLWADIDIDHVHAHAARDLTADMDSAMAGLARFPLQPSIIVHSGHGLQLYWLLDHPWQLDTLSDRQSAGVWLGRFGEALRGGTGLVLDSVFDLARVMRVPGSVNRKAGCDPVPVRILDRDDDRRYSRAEIEATFEPMNTSLRASPPRLSKNAAEPRGLSTDLAELATRVTAELERRGGEWRGDELYFRCILPEHHDANPSARWEPTKGVWCCDSHPGGRKGDGTIDIARLLGLIDPSTSWAASAGTMIAGDGGVTMPYCPPGRFKLDDIGNAERLAQLYGDRLRYCDPIRRWLAWDGQCWRRDDANEALRLAQLVARSLYHEAATEEDEDARAYILKHARSSAASMKVKAMLDLARPCLNVRVDELDADPWLLNVANGTIDLRTGELQRHDPARLITKLVPHPYVPDADLGTVPEHAEAAGRWQQFLETTTRGDADLMQLLQLAAGYTLAGDTREDVFFLIYGPGNTGKSTFLAVMEQAIGDYAATFNPEALMRRRDVGAPNPDIALLRGARLACSSEIAEGHALNAALLKSLTGGEKVSPRKLHENPTTWRPQFTMWVSTNSLPRVSSDDSGLWRRMQVIPFNASITPDPDLRPRLLATAAPVVLAWMVRGCLEWQRAGLPTASRVAQATADYRDSMDPLRDWLSDCCRLNENAVTLSADLWASYKTYIERGGERPMRQRDWGAALKARGCTPGKVSGKRAWLGVELVHDPTGSDVRGTAQWTPDQPPRPLELGTPGHLRTPEVTKSLMSAGVQDDFTDLGVQASYQTKSGVPHLDSSVSGVLPDSGRDPSEGKPDHRPAMPASGRV